MTAVTEPKKKSKGETLDNGTIVLIEDFEEQAPAKPGEPGFDWAAEYPDEEVFVYTAKDGVTVGVAAMTEDRKPTMGELKRILEKDHLGQMFETIERITSPAALDIAYGFKEPEFMKLLEAWTEWSSTTVGES